MSTLFFCFFKCIFFIFFPKNCWHYALLLVSFLLVGNNNDDTCGSVGTGRRARLRILWLLQSCGFKSHLPHQKTSTFVFCADGDMNPRFISPLRSGRRKSEIHRISCAPSSALFNLVQKPYNQGFRAFFVFKLFEHPWTRSHVAFCHWLLLRRQIPYLPAVPLQKCNSAASS